MATVAKTIIKSSIFLYPSKAEAESGSRRGGSGFLVCVPFEDNPQLAHIYGVTCAHMIWGQKGEGAPVVKLNKENGTPKILDLPPERWTCHSGAPDIAVCLLEEIDDGDDVTPLDISVFLTPEGSAGQTELGKKLELGDEIVMPGRLMGVPDRDRIRPVMRFGNLAQMPDKDAPILSNVAAPQVSFLVEMRSRTGFSGSPVFGYVQPSPLRVELDKQKPRLIHVGGYTEPRLLGVEWGQMGFEDTSDESTESVSSWRASSMLGVVPVWYLRELLMEDGFLVEQREIAEQEHADSAAGQGESAELPTKDENPQHKEDFSRLLDAAVREKQSDDQT